MIKPHERLGLLLGFFGMCLFAGTLPATQLAVSGFNPLFLTVARAALAGRRGSLSFSCATPSAATIALARNIRRSILHGGRFSIVRSTCDDDGARRSRWRCARYPAACNGGRGCDFCP